MRIKILSGAIELTAKLHDTPTTRALAEVLPYTARANTWGDEVYFAVPVSAALEPNAEQVVEPGTVGFWVEGQALALPFGPTPISERGECRLAARVNILGKIDGDPKLLGRIRSGDAVRVEPA